VNEIIGNLHLAQGKYAQAQQDFGSLKTNSAALAQLLNKDYAAAANTLKGVANPDGTTAYLQAIVASRIGNKSDAANALEKALKLDPSLRSYANKDLELMK
jgi:tetratricopeptide (TPR) repeat protein